MKRKFTATASRTMTPRFLESSLAGVLMLLSIGLGSVSAAFFTDGKPSPVYERRCNDIGVLGASIGGDRSEFQSNSTHRDLDRLSNEALYFLHNSGFASIPKEDANVVDELISAKVRNRRRFRQRKAEAQGRSEDEITSRLIQKWWAKMNGKEIADDETDASNP